MFSVSIMLVPGAAAATSNSAPILMHQIGIVTRSLIADEDRTQSPAIV
jgi:hypothetical protein